MLGENVSSPLVVPTPLVSATRSPIKERNSLGVLPFLIFNDEFQVFVVRVNRQFGTAAVLSSIGEQEIEWVMTLCLSLEDEVAKVDDIILVSAAHSGEYKDNFLQIARPNFAGFVVLRPLKALHGWHRPSVVSCPSSNGISNQIILCLLVDL